MSISEIYEQRDTGCAMDDEQAAHFHQQPPLVVSNWDRGQPWRIGHEHFPFVVSHFPFVESLSNHAPKQDPKQDIH